MVDMVDDHEHVYRIIEGDTVGARCKICSFDSKAITWDESGCAFLSHDEVERRINEVEHHINITKGLREFWKRLCTKMWDSWELDGGSFQDWGAELGLLREEVYDPEKHGFIEADPGDIIFVNALYEGNDNDEDDPVHTISET